MDNLALPVKSLKGVGEVRTRAFASLGVVTVADLLFFFPRRYEDRRTLTPLSQLVPDTISAAVASVVSVQTRPLPGRGSLTTAFLGDGRSFVRAIWFNNPRLERLLIPGARLALYGKVEERRGLQWTNPEFEILDEHDPSSIGSIVPVYSLASGLPQKYVRNLLKITLDEHGKNLVDFIPLQVARRLRLPPLVGAVRELHHPKSEASWRRARNRVAFDELFLLQVGLSLRRREREFSSQNEGDRLLPGRKFQALIQNLPFPLTGAQERVLREILADLRAPFPMYRLLQGDVGSGKTIIAAAAALAGVDSGVQTAFMAPTEILAQQHFFKFREILEPLNVRLSLLTGSLGSADRRAALSDIADGSAQIVLGTHAILSEGTNFSRLGLIVVDEQHRFGVMQKSALMEKARCPHLLVMTATPIPRTLTLSIYGDLDVSLLDELPPGRKPVKTVRARSSQEEKLLRFVWERVRAGGQVYWVCPVIDEGENGERAALTTRFQRLSASLPELRVSILHGQMPSDEKETVMRRFATGEIDILVATVVIEVGVDVPNATVMVVEEAGSFGLAQLHQLRGRVGRGDTESVCVLLEGRSTTPEGKARIRTMLETADGFRIAEADLKLRGPGEVCGIRQHGLTDFRVADLTRDQKILELARSEALNLVEADPSLNTAPLLKQELCRRLGSVLELAGTA